MAEAPDELTCHHARKREGADGMTLRYFRFPCAFPAGAADLPAIIWSKFLGLRNSSTWGSGATTEIDGFAR